MGTALEGLHGAWKTCDWRRYLVRGWCWGEGSPSLWTIDREQGQMNSWSNLELRPVARRGCEVACTCILQSLCAWCNVSKTSYPPAPPSERGHPCRCMVYMHQVQPPCTLRGNRGSIEGTGRDRKGQEGRRKARKSLREQRRKDNAPPAGLPD